MSDAFKDALNSSLVDTKKTPPKKKDVVEEGLGPNDYVPSGLGTASQGPLRSAQNPPYSLHSDIKSRINANDLGVNIQGRDETDAPPRFPYPLETVLDHLADGYIALKNVNSQIIASQNNPAITKAQKEELESIRNDIKIMHDDIAKLSKKIQKIVLD